ncbi:hypothetical protein D3C77_614090 [compost metagenome]
MGFPLKNVGAAVLDKGKLSVLQHDHLQAHQIQCYPLNDPAVLIYQDLQNTIHIFRSDYHHLRYDLQDHIQWSSLRCASYFYSSSSPEPQR